jgi:hypothetical protein
MTGTTAVVARARNGVRRIALVGVECKLLVGKVGQYKVLQFVLVWLPCWPPAQVTTLENKGCHSGHQGRRDIVQRVT